ncbi:MAG: NAD(P)/FAD-dependent oxidoreductase [Anaerolineae bacterium]
MRIAVIGAGFAGLAAAYDLVRAGHDVTVFEPMGEPGGLASGFRDESWDWPLERFYHHLFATDDDILGLAREVGFEDKVLTLRPITASFYDGRPYALDGPLPVLRFPGIPFVDRVRMGLVIAYLKASRDWRSLENVTVTDWLTRWMGHAAYEKIWEPLLLGKFGAAAGTVPMSWLWARLHKRSMRLIYFAGGFQAFADHLADTVTALGADVRLGTGVESIASVASGGLRVRTVGTAKLIARAALGGDVREDSGRDEPEDNAETYDRVIATVGPRQLALMVDELPPEYLERLRGLPHLGAVVAVLAMSEKLMDEVYWLSMDKREFPFLACVEHTNFIDKAHYGGESVVYVGDYVPPDHRYFDMSQDEILAEWYAALRRINPAFDESWVRRTWMFKAPYAQPVVSLGFSEHIPELATPVPGLYLASMSQVYPWDRGTNYAVAIGREAAALAGAD